MRSALLRVSEPSVPIGEMTKQSFSAVSLIRTILHAAPLDEVPSKHTYLSHRGGLLVVARDFPTNSGPLDAVGIDSDGEIYLIETKLYKNPDKRRVVAQVLDYGAALWAYSRDFANALVFPDQQAQTCWGTTVQDRMREFFQLDETGSSTCLESVRDNWRDGSFNFIVLMDSIDQRLKDLITFINQKSEFTIYGVEVERYAYEDLDIVIPKLYGAEVQKDITSPRKAMITEDELASTIGERFPDLREKVQTLFAALKASGLGFKGTPTGVCYGANWNGEVISIAYFYVSNVFFGLGRQAEQALGSAGIVECRRIINRVGTFYRELDVENLAKASLGPRYNILNDHSAAEVVDALKQLEGKVLGALRGRNSFNVAAQV